MWFLLLVVLTIIDVADALSLSKVVPPLVAIGEHQLVTIHGGPFSPMTGNTIDLRLTMSNGTIFQPIVGTILSGSAVTFTAPDATHEGQGLIQVWDNLSWSQGSVMLGYYSISRLVSVVRTEPTVIQSLGFDRLNVTRTHPWILTSFLSTRLCIPTAVTTSPECVVVPNVLVDGFHVAWTTSQFVRAPATVSGTLNVSLSFSVDDGLSWHVSNTVLNLGPPTPLNTVFLYPDDVASYAWPRAINQARFVYEDYFKSRSRGPNNSPYLENVWKSGEENALSTMMTTVDSLIEQSMTYFIMGSATFYALAPAAAVKYPQANFLLVTDGRFVLDPLPNLAFARGLFYEGWYLAGLAAGAVTRSNKLAFFITYPFPSYMNMANAFILGVKRSNPLASVLVLFLMTFADAWTERTAAEHAIRLGADVLASIATDVVPLVAFSAGKWAVGYGEDMRSKYGDQFILSVLFQWGSQFIEFGNRLVNNVTFGPDVYETGFSGGGVGITAMSPVVPAATQALIHLEKERLTRAPLQVFCGLYSDVASSPIFHSNGSIMIPTGECLSENDINSMGWFVQGAEFVEGWSNLLPVRYVATSFILSFGIAVLGCWTSLIILDQALSTVIHFGWTQALGWTGLSALAFGIGLWASLIVGITSFTLPSLVDPPTYFSTLVFGCLPLASMVTFCSFGLLLSTVQSTRKKSGEQMAAIGVAAMMESGTDGLDTASSGREETVTVLHPHGKTRLSTEEGCGCNRRILGQLRIKILLLLVGAGILLGAVLGTHSLLVQAVQLPVTMTSSRGLDALAILLFFLCSLPGLWIYFQFRASQYRFVGAFLLAAAIDAPHFVLLGSLSFFYQTTMTSSLAASTVLTGDVLQIVGAGVTCVASFLLIGFNVTRLRLSKDVLDTYLLKIQKDYRLLTTKHHFKGAHIQLMQSVMRRMHLLRPITIPDHYLLASNDTTTALPGGKRFAKTRDSLLVAGSRNSVEEKSIPGMPGSHLVNEAAILVEEGKSPETGPLAVTPDHLSKLTLDDILTNDVTLEIFKDYARDARCVENITFLLHVREYKRTQNVAIRQRQSDFIRRTFLAITDSKGAHVDAPFAVNISAALREDMLVRLARNASYPDELWNPIESEIMNLVRSNEFTRFKDSETFKVCALVIQLVGAAEKGLKDSVPPEVRESVVGT